ncbi:uncharacterized protein LOC142099303 isoform X2 [Mixophyes fleayi]|uniref:uncharacterized protein LOC142099303 isoform X2 n=1 Tax=Mixophyes fleayi TaxID=3061075 RepID=UPI003F4DE97A
MKIRIMVLTTILSSYIWTVNTDPDEDFVDPSDMLNYDAATQSMRMIWKKRSSTFLKEHLNMILENAKKLGLPGNNEEIHYDAEVIFTSQALNEISKFLKNEDWDPMILKSHLQIIPLNFKNRDKDIWKLKFEDIFSMDFYVSMFIPVLLYNRKSISAAITPFFTILSNKMVQVNLYLLAGGEQPVHVPLLCSLSHQIAAIFLFILIGILELLANCFQKPTEPNDLQDLIYEKQRLPCVTEDFKCEGQGEPDLGQDQIDEDFNLPLHNSLQQNIGGNSGSYEHWSLSATTNQTSLSSNLPDVENETSGVETNQTLSSSLSDSEPQIRTASCTEESMETTAFSMSLHDIAHGLLESRVHPSSDSSLLLIDDIYTDFTLGNEDTLKYINN